MSKIHHECEFEAHIVRCLKESGWLVGESSKYNKEKALYPDDVINWIKDSQPEAWEKLFRLNGDSIETAILERLAKSLENKDGGTLKVLRNGFSIAGAGNVHMSQALPEDDRNETVKRSYLANRLRVVPQLRYSLNNENAIDLVFFINGLPVATAELKTDFTQSVEAAMLQYRQDRPPKDFKTGKQEPLLTFKRGAIIHFAMSDSDIRMTTKLNGDSTYFLPFNQGNNGAAGNPPSIDGSYPVSYFWTRILQKDNWLRLFHRFVLFERKEDHDALGKTFFKESFIFPRFHQWESVTKVIEAVRKEGPGQPYLIQHSAGSGKTNTISWMAHELIRVRRADGEPYFNSVIIVTDRTVLDRQLQDAVSQIEHQKGVVKAIDRQNSSKSKNQQLAEAMLEGAPIIIVTLQTFPHAQKLILSEKNLRNRRFAVIIDEAHSSTGGTIADELRYTLTGQSEEEWEKLSTEERLSVWQSSRTRPNNASYFAFTATPKHSTISLFGRPKDPSKAISLDNPPVPFHLYSMQQAIEENFILDVLSNYTSYNVAFRIGSEFAKHKDERVDEKYAQRALAKWLALHPTNVAQKVELIVEHFRTNVEHLLNNNAKAMVVTSSRASAVKYKLAIEKYCKSRGYNHIRAMVAFSGDVSNKEVKDTEFSESHQFNEDNMNPELGKRDMRNAFDTPEYQVMIVANKFQTGFDQPKLVAMYLDKKISGVEAVQTLSRLNRTYPGKEKTYVIDFANEPSQIVSAFKTFYKDAQVSDIQDPNIIYDIKSRLDDMRLYEPSEIEAFSHAVTAKGVTHEKLYALTQPATDRFNQKMKQLNESIEGCDRSWKQAEEEGNKTAMQNADTKRSELVKDRDALVIFSESLSKFIRTYEYVAQLVEFGDPKLEAFASYARLLRKRLKGIAAEQVDLSDLVLTHLKISKGQKISGVSSDPETLTLDPIKDNGLREARDREKRYLSELIKKLNDAFGKEISDTDKVAFAVHVSEKLRGNQVVMDQIANNSREQAMKAQLPTAAISTIIEARTSHLDMANKLLSDGTTLEVFLNVLYELLKKDSGSNLTFEARAASKNPLRKNRNT